LDGFDEKLQKILNDPKALEQVAKLAGSLGVGAEPQAPQPAAAAAPASGSPADGRQAAGDPLSGLQDLLSGVDPKMLGGMMELANEFGRKDDRRTALLTALRPYVRAERQAKMDRAAQYVSLARVIRRGLGLFGGG